MPSNRIKKIIYYTWRPFILNYLKKDRNYKYKDVFLKVPEGVFHPGFFFSSKLLLEFISKQPVKHAKLLEPGAGAGLLSVYAAKHGAIVTATDINLKAVEAIKFNAKANDIKLTVICSDLFDDIPLTAFDFILINPPYYRRNPETTADFAWYCGEHAEYFEKLFLTMPAYMHQETKIYMVLSEDCDINGIGAIAAKNGFSMHEVLRKKKWWEWNYIFEFSSGKRI